MAGQNWSINIMPGVEHASFVPDVYTESGTAPKALQAQLNDLVSWNDQTGGEHEIWLTDDKYNQVRVLTDLIMPWSSSKPGYITQQADVFPATTTPPPPTQTIYYACSKHDDEHGTIEVVA